MASLPHLGKPHLHSTHLYSWQPSVEVAFAVPRMLTQTLSNLVTGNQDLLDQFWGVSMALPQEKSVLM
jgi:hypothetical protein